MIITKQQEIALFYDEWRSTRTDEQKASMDTWFDRLKLLPKMGETSAKELILKLLCCPKIGEVRQGE